MRGNMQPCYINNISLNNFIFYISLTSYEGTYTHRIGEHHVAHENSWPKSWLNNSIRTSQCSNKMSNKSFFLDSMNSSSFSMNSTAYGFRVWVNEKHFGWLLNWKKTTRVVVGPEIRLVALDVVHQFPGAVKWFFKGSPWQQWHPSKQKWLMKCLQELLGTCTCLELRPLKLKFEGTIPTNRWFVVQNADIRPCCRRFLKPGIVECRLKKTAVKVEQNPAMQQVYWCSSVGRLPVDSCFAAQRSCHRATGRRVTASFAAAAGPFVDQRIYTMGPMGLCLRSWLKNGWICTEMKRPTDFYRSAWLDLLSGMFASWHPFEFFVGLSLRRMPMPSWIEVSLDWVKYARCAFATLFVVPDCV